MCVYIYTRVTVTKYELPAEGTKKSLLMKNIPAFPFKCYDRKTTQSSIFLNGVRQQNGTGLETAVLIFCPSIRNPIGAQQEAWGRDDIDFRDHEAGQLQFYLQCYYRVTAGT